MIHQSKYEDGLPEITAQDRPFEGPGMLNRTTYSNVEKRRSDGLDVEDDKLYSSPASP